MTIDISGENILTVIGILIVLVIAIWRFHNNTHSKINDKIDGLVNDLAELNERVAWLEGRNYQYIVDQRERQERDSSERRKQDSLNRMELQNKRRW
ncbi:MAG: hypothetical protein MJE68_04625 [Proteobacteria bacterium]|nr:hypothetical protein [Pseudomonadota bacterium]